METWPLVRKTASSKNQPSRRSGEAASTCGSDGCREAHAFEALEVRVGSAVLGVQRAEQQQGADEPGRRVRRGAPVDVSHC